MKPLGFAQQFLFTLSYNPLKGPTFELKTEE